MTSGSTYPAVYIDEISSGIRTIAGVPTSKLVRVTDRPDTA